jgi:hypothetical protein
VPDRIPASGCWTRFDSWAGYLRLASVMDEHGRLRICKTGFDSSARY